MNTNILQEKINRRAEQRFQNDLIDFFKLLGKSPIGRSIGVSIDGEIKSLYGGNGYSPTGLFQGDRVSPYMKENTNIVDVRDKLLLMYIEEETEKIFSQLDILSQFIAQQ